MNWGPPECVVGAGYQWAMHVEGQKKKQLYFSYSEVKKVAITLTCICWQNKIAIPLGPALRSFDCFAVIGWQKV